MTGSRVEPVEVTKADGVKREPVRGRRYVRRFHKLSIERDEYREGGGEQLVVAMATEPAPCELDVYLNARELRDVIFAPLFCHLLPPVFPLCLSLLATCPLRRGRFRR